MPLIQYERFAFKAAQLDLIAKANLIIEEYAAQGYTLTLRGLYYQFVSRDYLPQAWADAKGILNRPESYNKLGNLISDGRMGGLIDWHAIADTSRSSHANQHWVKPSAIIDQARQSYATDKWANQDHYVEVWIEKEALGNIVARACGPLDIRYFACKGYTSQSAMWEASQRLVRKVADGKQVHIIHLGDHDPSGIDMSRDIYERLSLFVGHNAEGEDEAIESLRKHHVDVLRIALNMDQVTQYNPPPNPAKTTDSRFRDYQSKFGDESWELDALEPGTLVELITNKVKEFRNEASWAEAEAIEKKGRATLQYICQYFPEVVGFLGDHIRRIRKTDTSKVICRNCGATELSPKCMCDDVASRGIALGPVTGEE